MTSTTSFKQHTEVPDFLNMLWVFVNLFHGGFYSAASKKLEKKETRCVLILNRFEYDIICTVSSIDCNELGE